MNTSNVATPNFPMILMDDDLNELIEKHDLSQIEEEGDVIVFDRIKPVAYYVKGDYEDATVYKRMQTA